MKAMHLLKTGNYSGAENVAITIMEQMKEKYGVDSVYVSVHGDIEEILYEKKLKHFVIEKISLKEYQRAVNEIKPAVIHAHDFSNSIIAAKLKTDAVIISHLHNNPPWLKKNGARSNLYRFSIKRFKYILGVSASIMDEYVYGEMTVGKFIVVGNPLNIKEIVKKSEIAQEGYSSDVLFLGRLSCQKKPLFFIEIMDACKKCVPGIVSYMVGKGEMERKCRRKINELNLEGNISLTGFLENPYGYLKRTKVLCVPSEWEGFGLVVVEAFALGVPVVATPVGGMKTLVTEEAGKLCSSVEEFKDEIIRLITDERYHAKKSQLAYNRAVELDNLEKYVDDMYGYYRS